MGKFSTFIHKGETTENDVSRNARLLWWPSPGPGPRDPWGAAGPAVTVPLWGEGHWGVTRDPTSPSCSVSESTCAIFGGSAPPHRGEMRDLLIEGEQRASPPTEQQIRPSLGVMRWQGAQVNPRVYQ